MDLIKRAPHKVALLAFAVVLTGCAVGPDFKRPDAPGVTTYTPDPQPQETVASPGMVGNGQRFLAEKDIPAEWWSLFRSPPLNDLIRAAIKDSPTLAAAQAALREARENLNAQRGALLLPQVDGSLSAARQKESAITSGVPGGTIFNLYNASVNVSYTLDVFGGNRRELEALQSQVDYQNYLVEAAYLTLAANVVTAAVKEASLRAQLQSTRDIADLQQKTLSLIERQFAAGAVARTPILAQQTQVAQTLATLPPLEKSLAQTRHQLSVLAGKFPSDGGFAEFSLDALQLPEDLPLSLPSALARQRPDIRASEALLHAASAQIGVATANLYPQITLSGSYGFAATRTGDLFKSGNDFWSIGASLLQPLFHGGELTARRRAAIAAFEQAEAQYRSTVLNAFQEVADALRALESDAATLQAQAEAAMRAKESLDLTEKQYRLGAVSYLSLIDAQRQYQQTQVSLVQAQAARFADTAALFQALGGGWWNRDKTELSQSGTKQ
jgi:NodT family efflux transporter outer membrane factor (OMF) lipoprotein